MSGAVGVNASHINGVYTPSGLILNRGSMFKKTDGSLKWLWRQSKGAWVISEEKDIDANDAECWCRSEDFDLTDPLQVKTWKSLDDLGNFLVQPELTAVRHVKEVSCKHNV